MKKFLLFLILQVITGFLWSEAITLRVPAPVEPGHRYFLDLLKEAFSQTGHLITLVEVPVRNRQDILEKLEQGTLDLAWMVPSPDFGGDLVQIPFNLTKGLGGHRILILPGAASLHQALSQVTDLQGFRDFTQKYTGGVAEDSLDALIWKTNGLGRVIFWEGGDFKRILRGLGESPQSGYSYVPVSVLEAPRLLLEMPNLRAEANLVFIYPSDYRLHLSPKIQPRTPGDRSMEEFLQTTLEMADRKGVVERIISLHFRTQYETLNLLGRRKIFLKLPQSP